MFSVFRSAFLLSRSLQRTADRLGISRALRRGDVHTRQSPACRFYLEGSSCFANITVSAQLITALLAALAASVLSLFFPRRTGQKHNERNSDI